MNQGDPRKRGNYEADITASKELLQQEVKRLDEQVRELSREISEMEAERTGAQSVGHQKVDVSMLDKKIALRRAEIEKWQRLRSGRLAELDAMGYFVGEKRKSP